MSVSGSAAPHRLAAARCMARAWHVHGCKVACGSPPGGGEVLLEVERVELLEALLGRRLRLGHHMVLVGAEQRPLPRKQLRARGALGGLLPLLRGHARGSRDAGAGVVQAEHGARDGIGASCVWPCSAP